MNTNHLAVPRAVLVEEEIEFTLVQLESACCAERELLIALVEEGVLLPSGRDPENWRFAGTALRRARIAVRLTHDLEMSAAVAALVLDLLDEIEMLRAQAQHRGRG
jgi:chaperone modulatory protein CbpM